MDKKTLLSILWIVLTVNFMFCDIFTLMHSEDLQNFLKGSLDDTQITQEFLLGFAIVMEIPMIMILLSRILPNKSNRIIQIIAGIFLILIQSWSLSVGKVTLHYWFFSIVEIVVLAVIVWQAINWGTNKIGEQIKLRTEPAPNTRFS